MWLAGEPMAELCREFGISRKTGYKIFNCYQECGVQGLTDRSRRPYRYAHQLPFQVENYILNVKREHNSWGCAYRKLRDYILDTWNLSSCDSCMELGVATCFLMCFTALEWSTCRIALSK